MSRRLTLEEFIARSKELHGDIYDYSKTVYVDMLTPVTITCTKHFYTFQQAPVSHCKGKTSCPECIADMKRTKFQHTLEQAVSNLPKDVQEKYDFTDTVYNGYHNKARIRCKKHNLYFSVIWCTLYVNSGCPECSKEKARSLYSYTTVEFVENARHIYGDVYDYSRVDYVNSKEKVKIGCKRHGYFEKAPIKHLSGQGCPRCKSSRGESAIATVLDNLGVSYLREWSTPECKDEIALRFDFMIHRGNTFLLVEYDGKQHFIQNEQWGKDRHSKLENIKRRDGIKNKYCEERNIPLVRIPYWEYPNIEAIITASIKEHLNGQTE